MVAAFLSLLRSPDRGQSRFGSLSAKEREAVILVLDKLAYADHSA